MSEEFKVFIDLDGVAAAFDERVVEVCGRHFDETCWPVIDKIPNFFYHLDVLPGSAEAITEIISYGYETQILTATPRPTNMLQTTAIDKIRWVRKNIHPTMQVNCSVGWRCKDLWVAPNHILIDDMKRNIDHWIKCGGIGIHHKGCWGETLYDLNVILGRTFR